MLETARDDAHRPGDDARRPGDEGLHLRRERILDRVRETGYGSFTELGQLLGVSEMTIRRDVRKLEEQHLVRVVHGGVSAVMNLLAPLDYGLRAEQHTAAKQAIAARALTLLEGRNVVALDAGTTVLEVARAIGPEDELTVVTHSLPAMAALARRPKVDLVSLGGSFRHPGQYFAGSLALRSLGQLHVQVLFLAATAVKDGALWCTNEADAEMKQALIAAADQVVLLADSSKFSLSAMMRVADLATVATVVTDDLVSAAARDAIEGLGVRVVVVGAGGRPGAVAAVR
jgi:DeoR/GlpR family transcriptional regulator of sugar metabolism